MTVAIPTARMTVRRLGSHPPEYAGQGFWTGAVDLTKHSSALGSNDYVLSAASTPAENLDTVDFVLNREGKFASEFASPLWGTGVGQEPQYLSTGFTGSLPCIQFAGNDYLEDDAGAGAWGGETSFCIAITLEADVVADVNYLLRVSNAGGDAIAIEENGGFWTFIRGAKSYTSHAVTTAPGTLVYSYDNVAGLANMWTINPAGTLITQVGTNRDFSGTLGTLDAKRIGANGIAFNNNFLLRRLREVTGAHCNGRPGLLQALAAEIARDDN